MRIKLKDGTIIEQDAVMEIDTGLGTLFVKSSGDPDVYPGFEVGLLRPDGNQFCPMLVEVNEEEHILRLHYWSPWQENPVWDAELLPEEIDSAFSEEV